MKREITYKTKVCLACGKEYLPVSGRQKYCSDCGAEVRRKYRWSGLAQYLVDNADRLHEKERERNRRPERKQYISEWIEKHPDQVRESMNASGRKWIKKHPEKARLKNERRRARILNGIADGEALTLEQWHDTVEYFDHRCAYCGKKMDKLTIDHIVPLTGGGRHNKDNVVPACQPCNSRKNASSLLVYLSRRS